MITIDNQEVKNVTIDGHEVKSITVDGVIAWSSTPDFYIEYETTAGTQYQEFATGALLSQFILDNNTTFINHCKVVARLPEITDTGMMFADCSATSLDLSSFDTSSVTSMYGMFFNCSATSIDLSSFNTSNVSYMAFMFADCSATSLDLSSFDTSSVTNMYRTFSNCSATTGYARTVADANKFNASSNKPAGLVFVVK